ncbi:MAG: metallophosphoesterase [Nitriliruptoraceae bacterium]
MGKTAVRVLAGLVGLLVLLVAYGVLIEPRLRLEEVHLDARLDHLDDAWAGERVVVFSDLQVGMWFANLGMIERVVARASEEDPAAVLIPGDFIYGKDPDVEVQIEQVLDLLDPLFAAEIPVYTVLGNHDHSSGGAEELTDALEARGAHVLRNESVTIAHPDRPDAPGLRLVGVGPTRPGLADLDGALAGIERDEPRLVMMHNPTTFPDLPANSAPLTVAGHTHCGQISLPGTPHWSYLDLTEEEKLVADGYAADDYGQDGNRMYVTCGIGFSLMPMRVNAPPQLVVIELAPA